jgi:hypothetical protein
LVAEPSATLWGSSLVPKFVSIIDILFSFHHTMPNGI